MLSLCENMRSLEDMTVFIAHEIKNPISSALANLALIKMNDGEEEFKNYCSIIERELYIMNQLVIDVIRFYSAK